MSVTTSGSKVSSTTTDERFTVLLFKNHGLQEDICRALDVSGRWNQRDCELTAPLMVSFVLLLALHRHESIKSVLGDVQAYLRTIDRGVTLKPGKAKARKTKGVTAEAPIHARARLGVEPLKALFEQRAAAALCQPIVFGFRPWSVDGVRFLVQNTPDNEEYFGRPKASRGTTAFPQLLGTLLVSATSRMVRDAVWDRCTGSEREACGQLIRHLGPKDVIFGDRGTGAVWLIEACLAQKNHYVFRIPSNWKPFKIRSQGDGDYLATIHARVPITNEDGSTPNHGPKTRLVTVTVRVIEYRIGKCERVRLVTDLLDPEKYPALELAKQYHLRWEGELAFDEIKTHFTAVLSGILETTFRSKTPQGVIQEAYAVLVAYNLLRELIEKVADRHGIPSLEISFVETLVVVRRSIIRFQFASSSQMADLCALLQEEIAACRLKRSRRPRSYPRVTKIKMSKWPLKRRQHRQQPAPIDGGIQLVRAYRRRSAKTTASVWTADGCPAGRMGRDR